MKSIQHFEQSQIQTKELNKVKGGLLLTCEEKRGRFLGIIPYNYTAMVVKLDGNLGLTIRM